jgi:polyisoprenoid-binding protein YceI
MSKFVELLFVLIPYGCALVTPIAAQPRAIDTAKSTMSVLVGKAGAFSMMGHDHQITAPIAKGSVDMAAHSVELRVEAAALRVADPHVSDKDRAQIQQTMAGPEVLDASRYAAIEFRSTSAEPGAAGSWNVRGSLTLHGATQAVLCVVHESGGHYTGTVTFKQSGFGIKPVTVAGGAVRVKDEVQIQFDIQLAQ